jgi:asparagine synthase (glutamine-hydrolysing)
LVYAGRVDNRREIAWRLGRPALAHEPDGVVLAEAYTAWGRLFPGQVIGEYSFVLVDRESGTVLAARDSLGIGQLLIHETADAVYLASEMSFLLSMLPSPPRLDQQGLADFFGAEVAIFSGRTVYEGIREVPAARIYHHDGETGVEETYWEPPTDPTVLSRPEDYDESLRALLFDAVGSALRSNGPVGCELSGGLDSSTITSVAALLASSGQVSCDLAAHSMVDSTMPKCDESKYQQDVLALHPMKQYVSDSSKDLSVSLEFLDEECPAEPRSILYVPTFRRGPHARESRVRLCGEGGDQLFCADRFPPLHLGDWLRELRLAEWMRYVRAVLASGRRSLWNLVWHCSLAPGSLTAGRTQDMVFPEWLTPEFRRQAAVSRAQITRLSGPRRYASSFREAQWRQLRAMSSSVRWLSVPFYEQRRPLVYRPLVEFMLTIPPDQKLSPEQDRVILRRALKGILPESVRLRSSKGTIDARFASVVSRDWEKIRHLADVRELAALGLVEPRLFKEACDVRRHGLRRDLCFTSALTVEAWLRLPGRDRPRDEEIAALLKTHGLSRSAHGAEKTENEDAVRARDAQRSSA